MSWGQAMLPQSPLEYAVWGGLILIGWLFGYFSSTFEGKWRRRFHDERRFYAQYRDETDRLNIEKTRRITELEAQKSALSQEVVRLRSDVAALASPSPLPPVAPVAQTAAPEPVAETPAPALPDATSETAAEPVIEPVSAAESPAVEPHVAEPASAAIAAAAATPVAAAALTHPNILPHIETDVDPAAKQAPIAATDDGSVVVANADDVHPTAEEAPIETADAHAEEIHIPLDAELTGLTRIRGIDDTLAAGLASLGVRQVEDIERLSAEDEKAIEIQLNLPPGQIANQQWRLQAALIGSGEDGLIEPQLVHA
ncbi:hypothetical protein [Sphingomonas sp. 28-62-11]|uniref:hypothetical protein n=1 Tax=Sphingomonas sp. 28-62-11 TaxID=1970432 RepID=UPI0035A879D7